MLHLRILTTDRTVYNDMVDEITLPTESGVIGVLANHSPLITIVRPGQMTVKKGEVTITYTTGGGVLEVRPGSQAVLLVNETTENIA